MRLRRTRKEVLAESRRCGTEGFTLVEMLVALCILTFGLLAAAQPIYVALASTTLARSKGGATVAAQNQLELLADLYRRDPNATDLSVGSHGPVQVQVVNPVNSSVLNRYNVAWAVATVPDPRAGRNLNARQVTVTVTPIGSGTSANNRALLNKVVNMSAVFSVRVP